MESSPGSQGAGRWPELKAPICSRRSLNLQVALLLVIFSTHSQWVGANRDKSITVSHTTGPWDKALKTERHCLDFHWKNASTYFFYWPEDDPDAHFEYCCSDETETLQNYTYGNFGPILGLGDYYDLGLIDRCLPYWKCNHLFQTYFESNLYYTSCEVNDLRKLYKRRFIFGTVLQHGLFESAIPFIISSEILVVCFVALYWCIWGRPVDGSKAMIKDATKAWIYYSSKTIFKDWTHLCLLAIVGNGLIEAIGRQDPYSAQSKSFYNYAQLYIVLSILVWYSSVLLQVTYWIAEMELESAKREAAEAAHSPQNNNVPEGQNQTIKGRAIPELENIFELNDDWKWQPIAAQAGILFCLWVYLTYSAAADDEEGKTSDGVFGLIVSAACPWSGLYASKVIARAFLWHLTRLIQKLRKPQQTGQPYLSDWRSVLHLKRLTSNHQPARSRTVLARQNDSGGTSNLLEQELDTMHEP